MSDSSPGNLPAQPGTAPDPIQRGERTGMFGAQDTGDTSGYGGLRTHVDDDPLLGTGADLADDVIPVPADGVEDALVGIRVGLGKGIAAGDLEVLVDSGEDRAVVAHQV